MFIPISSWIEKDLVYLVVRSVDARPWLLLSHSSYIIMQKGHIWCQHKKCITGQYSAISFIIRLIWKPMCRSRAKDLCDNFKAANSNSTKQMCAHWHGRDLNWLLQLLAANGLLLFVDGCVFCAVLGPLPPSSRLYLSLFSVFFVVFLMFCHTQFCVWQILRTVPVCIDFFVNRNTEETTPRTTEPKIKCINKK